MGIGINNNSDSAISSAIGAGAKVGAGVAAFEAAKALKPAAINGFNTSIMNQADLIDKFQKSGQTVEQYMKNGERIVKGAGSPGVTYATLKSWTKQGLSNEQILEKMKKMDADAVQINKMGTDKALKKLNASKKLFETGETSKLQAVKDAAGDVLSKVKDKAVSLKDGVTSAFKSTEGTKLEKLKAAGNSVVDFLNKNPKIKKGGKTALIAAAATGALALILKAVSNHNKEKQV